MKTQRWLACLGVVLAIFFTSAAVAGPEEAAAKFALGRELIAKADFEGALRAYNSAAKADRKNDTYRQAATLLQRVLKMRKGLDKLTGAEWRANAYALHAFYTENNVHTEAIPLARRIHAELDMPESSARLARTALALGRNAEVAELLQGMAAEQRTPELNLLLGLALARQDQLGAAQAAIAGLTAPSNAGGAWYFDLACVQARVGQTADALTTLSRSFEQTSPSQLEAARARARVCADLAALRTAAGFDNALATESKIAESACSTGESCGKCPSRATCASAKADGDKHDAAAKEVGK